jgi:hypothetical protein
VVVVEPAHRAGDPDGITVYVFGSRFKRYDGVSAATVARVFLENEPCGGTDDKRAVMRVIVDASKRIERDEELGVSLVQVGDDPAPAAS